MGLLSETERQEVEANARQYPEIQQELEEITDALSVYAQAQAVPMPDGLTDKILGEIDARSAGASTSNNPPSAGSSSWTWTLGGLLIGSLLFIVLLMNQNRALQNQLLDGGTTCDSLRTELEQATNRLEFINNAGNTPIALKGTDNSPEAAATVYLNEEANVAYMDVRSLPNPDDGYQFQVWAIKGEAKNSIGLISLDYQPGDLVEIDFFGDADAFAVSMEVEGGSVEPNLGQIFLFGNCIGG